MAQVCSMIGLISHLQVWFFYQELKQVCLLSPYYWKRLSLASDALHFEGQTAQNAVVPFQLSSVLKSEINGSDRKTTTTRRRRRTGTGRLVRKKKSRNDDESGWFLATLERHGAGRSLTPAAPSASGVAVAEPPPSSRNASPPKHVKHDDTVSLLSHCVSEFLWVAHRYRPTRVSLFCRLCFCFRYFFIARSDRLENRFFPFFSF